MRSMSMRFMATFLVGLQHTKQTDRQQQMTSLTASVTEFPRRKIWQYVLCYHHTDLSEVVGSRRTSMPKQKSSLRTRDKTHVQAALTFQAFLRISTPQRHQVPCHGVLIPRQTIYGQPLRLQLHRRLRIQIRPQQQANWLLKVLRERTSRFHGDSIPLRLRHQPTPNQPLLPVAASLLPLLLMNRNLHVHRQQQNHRIEQRGGTLLQYRAHGHHLLAVGLARYEGGHLVIALCKMVPFQLSLQTHFPKKRRRPPSALHLVMVMHPVQSPKASQILNNKNPFLLPLQIQWIRNQQPVNPQSCSYKFLRTLGAQYDLLLPQEY